MNIPQFTGQASLYRTSNRYRSSGFEVGGSRLGESVMPAYFPGAETQDKCSTCLDACAAGLVTCNLAGGIACGVGCISSLVFWGACFAGCEGAIIAGCDLTAASCAAVCAATVCCPKACGTPNPFDPGQGCCDENEGCVDRYDPNSRGGCCPSDQAVCAGQCCAKGESCCGDTCCPANYFCRDGNFCSEFPSNLLPPAGTPAPPGTTKLNTPERGVRKQCPPGTQQCGAECCPPELQCCDLGGGRVGCRTTCVA
jgi:hypothetical protein